MTTQHRTVAARSGRRAAARVLALIPALLLLATTGTAVAEPPDSWENTPAVSGLYVVVVLVAIPLALFGIIWLLVYLPSMAHGERYRPSEVWRHEPEWFGGPRGGVESLTEGAPEAQPTLTAGGTAGGTSGEW